MQETLSNKKPPCAKTLSKILNESFRLKYKHTDKSKLKYKDPTYNEKRLWVSRLLAQFLFEGVLIISIDESSFKSDVLNHKQWEFHPNLPKKRLKNDLTRTPGVFSRDNQVLLKAVELCRAEAD